MSGPPVFLPVFRRVLGGVQFHVVAVVLRMQLPVAGVGDVVAARVLGWGRGGARLLRGSPRHQGFVDGGCHLLVSHAPLVSVESGPWAGVLLPRGLWGGRGRVALFGTCLGRPWGCRAFAIKMRRFLWGRWLLRHLFFWIFFSVYTFLKSLLDIIWAWGKMTNGKGGDRGTRARSSWCAHSGCSKGAVPSIAA